ANTSIMLAYLSLFWPAVAKGPVRSAVICAIVLAVTTINLVGVRDVTVATNIFTLAKLAPLTLLIVAGLFHLDAGSFAFGPPPSSAELSGAMMLLVYAYTGFEMTVIPAAEIRDPRRDLPRAILTGIGIVAVFYILIQVVCIGALPGLSFSDRPLADAASRVLGRAGAAIVAAGAVISIAGNLNVVVFSASRLPFAMAQRGELPRFLVAVHRHFRTPHASILLTVALMGALTLSGTFLYAVALSTISRLLVYAATCAALPVLRKRAGVPAPFPIRAGLPLSVAVLALTAWLLWNTTGREVRDTGVVAAIGFGVFFFARALRSRNDAVNSDCRK
ncbi:MAG: APC family permease, partial [Bryobacteraceae bacterium]